MEKEFNLSELWNTFKDLNKEALGIENFENALKEFIKLLNEDIVLKWNEDVDRDIPINPKEIEEIIDKRAGDKLI